MRAMSEVILSGLNLHDGRIMTVPESVRLNGQGQNLFWKHFRCAGYQAMARRSQRDWHMPA